MADWDHPNFEFRASSPAYHESTRSYELHRTSSRPDQRLSALAEPELPANSINSLKLDSPQMSKESRFRGVWHEIAFIVAVIMAQDLKQMNLGNTIIQARNTADTLGAEEPQESWFVASYSTTVGAFVLASSRLGDIYGIKRLWIYG